MRITIRHETHYQLEEAARRAMQYLRLTPRYERNQRIIHWSIKGPQQLTKWRDGFGNDVHFATEIDEHHELKIVVEGEVETKETNGILPLDDGLPPGMFLRPTDLIKFDEEIEKFGNEYSSVLEKEGQLAFLHQMMGGLNEHVTYKPGFSTVASPAVDVMKAQKGVCQDFAHLFISLCHANNIPARYVSGYITEGVGEAASHAWAESYVNELGWVSFDPANCQSATQEYVRLAVGYDYQSAAPITGVRSGGEGEEMKVDVNVSQSQSQS